MTKHFCDDCGGEVSTMDLAVTSVSLKRRGDVSFWPRVSFTVSLGGSTSSSELCRECRRNYALEALEAEYATLARKAVAERVPPLPADSGEATPSPIENVGADAAGND